MATFELNMSQIALAKQMAQAWRLHLRGLLQRAKRAGHDIAINNTEADIKEVEDFLKVLNNQVVEAEKVEQGKYKFPDPYSNPKLTRDIDFIE